MKKIIVISIALLAVGGLVVIAGMSKTEKSDTKGVVMYIDAEYKSFTITEDSTGRSLKFECDTATVQTLQVGDYLSIGFNRKDGRYLAVSVEKIQGRLGINRRRHPL